MNLSYRWIKFSRPLIFMFVWFIGLGDQGSAQSETLSKNLSAPMIQVPAGPFVMGSPEGIGRSDEMPPHQVYLETYQIDRYEITNAQYLTFVKETAHPLPPNPYGAGKLSEAKGIGEKPVVQITWHDAMAYCHWAGKRMPTEAEWEKAARGSDQRLFPWGNNPPTPQLANFGIDWKGRNTLRPIGKTPQGRSFYGVEDMAGNVREWVQDWYHPEYYANAPVKKPRGPAHGILKVIRGGSWHHGTSDIRATARGKGGFALKTDGIGFRCASSAQP